MASKGKFRRASKIRSPFSPAAPSVEPCEQRLRNLSLELSLAGGQVLKEHFNFTTAQVNEWLDLVVKRAKENRESGTEKAA